MFSDVDIHLHSFILGPYYDRISRRVYWSCLHVLNFFGKLFSSTSTFKLRWMGDDWRAEGKPNRHSSIELHIKSSLTLGSASKLTSETLTPPRAPKKFWSAHGCSTGNFFHRSSQDCWKKIPILGQKKFTTLWHSPWKVISFGCCNSLVFLFCSPAIWRQLKRGSWPGKPIIRDFVSRWWG